jgi:hypothetical protein
MEDRGHCPTRPQHFSVHIRWFGGDDCAQLRRGAPTGARWLHLPADNGYWLYHWKFAAAGEALAEREFYQALRSVAYTLLRRHGHGHVVSQIGW